jgi:hypothetical protein
MTIGVGTESTGVRLTSRSKVIVLAALVAATWLPRMNGPLDLRWDGGVYYVLGTSLAQGHGYRLLNEPGEIEATQYPPLFPAFIAAHQIIAGTSDPTKVGRLLRFSSFLMSLGFVLATYALLRRLLPEAWALVGAGMCALQTYTVFLSDIAFAEIPFALATILFFLWRRQSASTSIGHDLIAGLLASVAYLLRTAGVALLVAWVAEGVLQRNARQSVLRFAIALLVIAGWQARIASVENDAAYSHPSYPYQRAAYLFYNVSYARNMRLSDVERPELGELSTSQLSKRFMNNLITVPNRLGQGVSAVRDDWGKQISTLRRVPVVRRLFPTALIDLCLLLLGGLVIGGLVMHFIYTDRLMPLYVAGYIALLCITPPAWESARYLLPIAPFLVLALCESVLAIRRRLQTGPRLLARLAPLAVYAGTAIVLTLQILSLTNLFRERHRRVEYHDRSGALVTYKLLFYREAYQALDAGLDWLRSRAGPTEVIASSMPHWVYLRTGLKAVMPPFESDPRRAQALLDSVPVNYLIVDGRTGSFTRQFGLPAVKAAPELWQLIYLSRAGELEIYRRSRP